MTVAEMVEAEKTLGTQLEKYAGQWVATDDYEVVGNADTLGELLEQLESKGIEGDQATVLQVPAEKATACFF